MIGLALMALPTLLLAVMAFDLSRRQCTKESAVAVCACAGLFGGVAAATLAVAVLPLLVGPSGVAAGSVACFLGGLGAGVAPGLRAHLAHGAAGRRAAPTSPSISPTPQQEPA